MISVTSKPLSFTKAIILRDMIRIKYPMLNVNLIHTTSGSVLVYVTNKGEE